MKQYILPSIKLTGIFLALFCGLYTLVVLGIAEIAPNKGMGETVEINGKTAGYLLEGQNFTLDKYFWGRPSAVNYNASGSGASNKSPANPDYLKDVRSRIDTFLQHNPGIKRAEIPSELVTASASGLDPHLSLQGVYVQIPRVARTRNLTEDRVRALVDIHT